MKKSYLSKCLIILQIVGSAFIVSCGSDDDSVKVFNAPTISVSASSECLEIGQTVDITLAVAAEAGLTSLTADGAVIKSYGGTEVSDEFVYQASPTSKGLLTIAFQVVDTKAKTADASFELDVKEAAVPTFVISDLGGALSESVVVDVENGGWDIRTVSTFANTSSLNPTSATMQFVASQGHASFGQDNPDASQSDKVLQLVGSPDPAEAIDSWGGHYIFGMINLGEVIPESELSALPQLEFNSALDRDDDGTDDTGVASIAAEYTRVIQVDAYYDDTVNPNLSMNDIKQIDAIYGLDLPTGYQIDLILGKNDPHSKVTTGEVQGMYAAYSAWITEPNKWVTLTFDMASEAQQQFLNDGDGPNDESAKNPAAIGEVDVVTLVSAYSHDIWGTAAATSLDGDTNPLYFKNLRIVNTASPCE